MKKQKTKNPPGYFLRLPPEMMAEFRGIARKRGERISVIMREALRAYLPIPRSIAQEDD